MDAWYYHHSYTPQDSLPLWIKSFKKDCTVPHWLSAHVGAWGIPFVDTLHTVFRFASVLRCSVGYISPPLWLRVKVLDFVSSTGWLSERGFRRSFLIHLLIVVSSSRIPYHHNKSSTTYQSSNAYKNYSDSFMKLNKSASAALRSILAGTSQE